MGLGLETCGVFKCASVDGHMPVMVSPGVLPVQGHALFTREAGGDLPCPTLDFTGGFNQFLGAAYGLHGQTVQQAFGAPFGTLSPCSFLSMLSSVSAAHRLELRLAVLWLWAGHCPSPGH